MTAGINGEDGATRGGLAKEATMTQWKTTLAMTLAILLAPLASNGEPTGDYKVTAGVANYRNTENTGYAGFIQLSLLNAKDRLLAMGIGAVVPQYDPGRASAEFAVTMNLDKYVPVPFLSLEPGIYIPFSSRASIPESIGFQLGIVKVLW